MIRLEPKTWNHRVVVWIDRRGKQALFTTSGDLRPSVQTLLEKGFAVVAQACLGRENSPPMAIRRPKPG